MTSLAGTVTLEGAEPARAATVELHNATGDVVDQVQVDDGGQYRYHLSAGRWTLNVWDPYGHRGRAEVELADGDEKVLDIDLDQP